MKKVIKLTESDLTKLIQTIISEQEQNEGILDNAASVFQGAKGFVRGDGYNYFKHLSLLRSLARKLKQIDKPNEKIMTQLNELKTKVSGAYMEQSKRDEIINLISNAESNFNAYKSAIDAIENRVNAVFK